MICMLILMLGRSVEWGSLSWHALIEDWLEHHHTVTHVLLHVNARVMIRITYHIAYRAFKINHCSCSNELCDLCRESFEGCNCQRCVAILCSQNVKRVWFKDRLHVMMYTCTHPLSCSSIERFFNHSSIHTKRTKASWLHCPRYREAVVLRKVKLQSIYFDWSRLCRAGSLASFFSQLCLVV